MAGPYRLVFEFQGNPDSSWSEVYYTGVNTAALAADVANSWLKARTALLTPLATLVRVRASSVVALRDTATKVINVLGKAPNEGGPIMAGGTAWLTLTGQGGGTRRLALRGLPDAFLAIDAATGKDAPPPSFRAALKTFSGQCNGVGYGILRIKGITPPPGLDRFSKWAVTKVDGTVGPGKTAITIKGAGAGFVYPGTVAIAQMSAKDYPRLNGRFSLLAPPVVGTDTTILVPYTAPGLLMTTPNGGYVRQLEYQPVSVFDGAETVFSHYGTRGTRVPLSRSRGARRAARIRQSP